MNKQKEEIAILIRALAPDAAIRRLAERENRSFGRGMTTGVIITAFVAIFTAAAIFVASRAVQSEPPSIEQQLNDTLNLSLSVDSEGVYYYNRVTKGWCKKLADSSWTLISKDSSGNAHFRKVYDSPLQAERRDRP